jgi:hypothetical protein
MLNWPVPSWAPATSAREDANPGGVPFDLASAFEAQTRLWNHLLDANRSLWAFYAPWIATPPWFMNSGASPAAPIDAGEEPAQTADGLPDAFESQTRLWNHMVDANRQFWSAVTWAVPGAPWLPTVDDSTSAANDEKASADRAPARRGAAAGTKRRSTRSR